MTESAMIYVPRAPDPASLSNPRLSICDGEGRLVAHYCTRNRCGGIYDLQNHCWTLYTPITLEEFVSAFGRLGFRVANPLALETWLDGISAAAAQKSGHH